MNAIQICIYNLTARIGRAKGSDMKRPMMKCGCAGQADRVMPDGTRKPSCITHSCDEIAPIQPNLVGRKAKCSYGCVKTITDSSLDLAFFEHKPDAEFDRYYCGCYGWD